MHELPVLVVLDVQEHPALLIRGRLESVPPRVHESHSPAGRRRAEKRSPGGSRRAAIAGRVADHYPPLEQDALEQEDREQPG
jgi:hypothetical protein